MPTIKGVLKRDPKVYQFLDSNPDRQDVLHTLIDQIYGYIVANANKNEPIQVDDVSAIVEFLMLVQNEHRLALLKKLEEQILCLFRPALSEKHKTRGGSVCQKSYRSLISSSGRP
ncbi:MAG: hypothetical protein IPK04_15480 [Bdellovibrionales bacterium]|nr:hypothetical protein [Bdellovibrionales bacterium]